MSALCPLFLQSLRNLIYIYIDLYYTYKASSIPGFPDLKKFLQPDGGLFGTVIDQKSHLSGHENVGTIVVNMQFAAGEQGVT